MGMAWCRPSNSRMDRQPFAAAGSRPWGSKKILKPVAPRMWARYPNPVRASVTRTWPIPILCTTVVGYLRCGGKEVSHTNLDCQICGRREPSISYNDTLAGGLTSHAKIDPKTGELFFISWGRKPPFLHVGIACHDGKITRHIPVLLPGPRVQHDMAISDRFICVFDFPLMLDSRRNNQDTLGFIFHEESPARIGLIDRRDAAAPPQWFSILPSFMWHLSSAWDEGDEFVLVGARIRHPTRRDSGGRVRDDGPIVDGEHRFDARPYMWRLNLKTGAVSERQLDDAWVEFPRVNDKHLCAGARYSYMVEIDRGEPTLKAKGVLKYDLAQGRRERLRLPDGHIGNEVSFAPRDGSTHEDDGFLVGFVTNEVDSTSEFWITPAQALADGPVARVKLPQKVPPKFHGRWLSADKLR